ncbi:hypothetical protein WMY93_033898 [Mugilogobius chulae]|uniref:ATP-dependent DNA helicase n=1 Tax=Mugilogobius chulae TaxID=88201 RepID=A0AAW0MS58_9GOBI
MRQKDVPFAQLLNRLRLRSKETQLRRRDVEALKQRETGEETADLHIYAKKDDVYAHNIERLKQLDPDYVTMYAQDFSYEKKTGKYKKLDGHLSNATHTNLAETLEIAKNARVMLCKNVDAADGLVNGVCGTVAHIENPNNLRLPVAVYVTFDDPDIGVQRRRRSHDPADLAGSTRIEPEEEIATKRGEKRRQFPLRLAWAITIHKVQGMTLDKAVVSLKGIFTAGQAYVALSRVRSLEGLILQEFNEEVIYCNDNVKLAMEYMPPFIVESPPVRHGDDVLTVFS